MADSTYDPADSGVDLRRVFDAAPFMVVVHDSLGRIVEANATACKQLGYEREGLLRLSVNAIEGEPNSLCGEDFGVLAEGELEAVQGVYRRSDDTTFAGEVRRTAFQQDGSWFISSVWDPTASPQGQGQATCLAGQLEPETFRRIFEEAAEAIAVLDHEGRYLLQNKAHRDLLGYADGDLVGKTPAMHMGPAAFQEASEALTRDGVHVSENLSRTRDGETVPVELTAFAVPMGPERPPVLVWGERRLNARSEVQRERWARERLHLEEGLRQAQKMEVIGRLAGGVAHDFNNLLTPILGYADAELSTLAEDDPMAEVLRRICQAAERGRELAQQLLTFGRKRVLHRQAIDLRPCAERVARMLRRVLPEDVEIELDLAEELSPVFADEAAIEQVLMNLITNSRDAMSGGGRMVVTARDTRIEEDDPLARSLGASGVYVELSVKDAGHGMDSATLEQMFEPFFTSRSSKEHSGLGLSVVHGIVNQHEGVIHATSVAGSGAMVRVILPRHLAPAQRVSPVLDLSFGAAEETILVAEDDPQVRVLVAGMLEELGYSCLPASNGIEALRLAEGYPGQIDLLLSDVVMPGIGGKELYDRLRVERPELAVLFMSGYARDGLAIEVIGARVGMIEKPFSAAELRRCLAGCLASTGC
jgi:two-component system cell cycle sensor histidine kinase/response regulator CckA